MEPQHFSRKEEVPSVATRWSRCTAAAASEREEEAEKAPDRVMETGDEAGKTQPGCAESSE